MSDELQDRLDTLENEYEALTQDIDTLKSERDEAEARAEAAEQQAARLRSALIGVSRYPEGMPPCWCVSMNSIHGRECDQASAALAASQPAPAAEMQS